MEYLCHHIMDLAENSTAAGAGLVQILLVEDLAADRVLVEIRDDGRGMTPEQIAEVNGPIGQCKSCGLGLTLFARACQEAEGRMEVSSAPGQGTVLRGEMKYEHHNRRPIGDLGETLITLIMGAPSVNWLLRRAKVRADQSREEMTIDTRAIRAEAGGAALTHPEIIRCLRAAIRQHDAKWKDGSRE